MPKPWICPACGAEPPMGFAHMCLKGGKDRGPTVLEAISGSRERDDQLAQAITAIRTLLERNERRPRLGRRECGYCGLGWLSGEEPVHEPSCPIPDIQRRYAQGGIDQQIERAYGVRYPQEEKNDG